MEKIDKGNKLNRQKKKDRKALDMRLARRKRMDI